MTDEDECKICNGEDIDGPEDIEFLCKGCQFELAEAKAMRGEWRYREP
jgi:hypothetical protein